MALVPYIHELTVDNINRAIRKLASSKLGPNANVTYKSLTLTGLTASQLLQTDANKKLTSIALPLIVAKGGTGAITLTDHGILLGSGTGAITPLGVAGDGQIPIGSAGADPVLAGITGTTKQITVTNAAGSITLSLPQDYDTAAIPTLGGLITAGTIDASAGKVLVEDSGTAEPTGDGDGYIGVAVVGGDPRIYFKVEGNMYYVCNDGVLVGPQAGNPIGLLLSLTYA